MMAKLKFYTVFVSHDLSEIILICWFGAQEIFDFWMVVFTDY